MPYAVCVNAVSMPGDVGFGVYHNPDAEIAVAGDLLQVTFYLIAADVTEADQQTNLRTPLPKEIFVKTRPGHKDWDDFIVWLYECSNHPAFRLNDSHWSVAEIHENRAMEDWTFGEKYLTPAASEYYCSVL